MGTQGDRQEKVISWENQMRENREEVERIYEGQERDRNAEEERCCWMKARGKVPVR